MDWRRCQNSLWDEYIYIPRVRQLSNGDKVDAARRIIAGKLEILEDDISGEAIEACEKM
jgi:hypothetical protein